MMDSFDDRPAWNNMRTPSVLKRMEMLYETRKWHDCVFKLWRTDDGGEELVKAHSLILASSSPVFEALCFGPLADESPISVPDVDPVAFTLMIKFIYTDNISFDSVENACNVLYVAKKYFMYTLVGLAISYILHHIDETNCLQVYKFASFIYEEKLIKNSWLYLSTHLEEAIKYFSYDVLSKDVIVSLVNEEALNGGEMTVFNICMLWAEGECTQQGVIKSGENLRKVLLDADILNKIRWLTLTQQEFENGPKTCGIFSEDELNFLTKTIEGSHLEETNNPPEPKIPKSETFFQFTPAHISNNMNARSKIALKMIYCYRFIESEVRPLVLPNPLKVCTVITSNKSARLTAIYLNAKILPIPQINVVYTHTCVIERDYKEKILLQIYDSNDMELFSTLFSETVKYGTSFKIMLRHSVYLERFKEYKVVIQLKNSIENYYFAIRNSVSSFPSGLSVSFKDLANVNGGDKYVEAPDLSLISGLDVCI